jgi:signal transduction histidine kinase
VGRGVSVLGIVDVSAPRKSSLFWTITGVLLAAIVTGTAAQWLIAAAVVGPLERREAKARAELVASSAAAEIAALPDPGDARAIRMILVRHRAELDPPLGRIVYRGKDGLVVADAFWRGRRMLPGRFRGWTPSAEAPPGREGSPDGSQGGPVGGPGGPMLGPPAGDPGRGAGLPPRVEILARHAVVRSGVDTGDVIVIRPGRSPAGILAMRTPLLFLPVAVIAATIAGLVMMRILVRRLGALETLASRVGEGDLSVRIGDRSGDEIGRVAGQLDLMTERLAEARKRVEEAGEQRRRLFADVTHELATPLTSIRGYAETMTDPSVPISGPERARYLDGILEESKRLDRLIKDLFDLARLEAGASPLEMEAIDWAPLCQNTIARFEPRFRDAGLRLQWAQAGPPAWIRADGRRMEQVLENLLVNELKYVPSGGSVDLSMGPAPGADDRIRLTVSDDGPGIPPEERARVFERFYRSAGRRDDAGSGLGLAIVREIVERHGGVIHAEPRAPRGLSIVIDLPRMA